MHLLLRRGRFVRRFRQMQLPLAVAHHAGDQPLEGRAVAAGEVGHVAGIDTEQHFGRRVAELCGDPLRAFAGGQPQGSRGVPALVGSARRQAQMPQQGMPDAVGDVLVIERRAVAGAEDVLRELPGRLLLFLQGVIT